MTDWLRAAVSDLSGTGRTYSSWLEALHEQAPHAAHDIATEQQARERWVEIAESVYRHPTTPARARDIARRVLDAVGAPASNDSPEEGGDDDL